MATPRLPDSGQSFPLGATLTDGGANFSVYARDATGMELLFFDHVDDPSPARVISLDPFVQRTGPYWHAFVAGAAPGQLYAYRATGPFDPAGGRRFDPQKVLLDPYGRGVSVPLN